jgi:hypothetical protein
MNLLSLLFAILFVLALKVEFNLSLKWIINDNYNCVVDERDTEARATSCLLQKKILTLSCERDLHDKNCGNNGCISVSFHLKSDSEKQKINFDEINFVQYIVSVNKEEDFQEKMSHRKTTVQNNLEGESYYSVSLNNQTREALLKIRYVSYFYEYKICVDPFFTIATDNPDILDLKKVLCCKILFEEPEEEIITFHLEIIIIAFLLIFYIIIIVMAWKCKHKHEDDHIIVEKPIPVIENKKELPKRNKIEIHHVDDTDQNIEVIVQDPIIKSNKKKVVQPTVMFDDINCDDDEENMRRYSLNKRRATGFGVPRQNIKKSEPTDSKTDIKKIQDEVKKNLRRKSVQFNKNLVDVRKMSARMPDTDNDDDKDDEYTIPDEEAVKQQELNVRRKSMLLGPEFFKDLPKKKTTKNDTFNPAEEAARKAFANKNRRASAAYAVQKAKSLNVSDDSD